MKPWLKGTLLGVFVAPAAAAWILYLHNPLVTESVPQWSWLQETIRFFGKRPTDEAATDEDPDNTKNEIPVHTAQVTTATMHRYIEGFGTVVPRPPRAGEAAGSANLASAVPGVVAKVFFQPGQRVRAGEAVIQLDDRLAKSAEDQADAALAQAMASLAALKATPRPDQLQIAELTVEKSQSAQEFAQKAFDRVKQLAVDQGASAKAVEQSAMELAAAKTDLIVSRKQLALLKSSPTPQELAQEESKVRQSQAALATATLQRQMMALTSPIDATVVAVLVTPGESVDITRPLVQLIAMDRLGVDLDVAANQVPANVMGLRAQVLFANEGDGKASDREPLEVKVASASPQVDARNGSVRVSLDLPVNAGLRPGLMVRARLVAEEHKDCLVVPRDAVVTDENGDSVISVVEGSQATHKTVRIGFEENGMIEVIGDGLANGMVVVTAGEFGLPGATRVKVLD